MSLETFALWAPALSSLAAMATAMTTLGIFFFQEKSRKAKERSELWHQMTSHFIQNNAFFDKHGIPGPGDAENQELGFIIEEYRLRNAEKPGYELNLSNALYYQLNIAHLFFLNRDYLTEEEMRNVKAWFLGGVCPWARLLKQELGPTLEYLRTGQDLFSKEFTEDWIKRGF